MGTILRLRTTSESPDTAPGSQRAAIAKQERAHITRVASMDRNTQIEELYPLALALAKRIAFRYPRVDPDDIVSDASLGIILAVDRYDPSRGMPLRLYAAHKVYATVFNGMRRRDPVSERVRRTMREATRYRYDLAHDLGRLPSLAELEHQMPGLREARIRHARMDVHLLGDAATKIKDFRNEPQRVFDERTTYVEAHVAIDKLSQRQRQIVEKHYDEGRVLRAIGADMNVTPQRVSQLHVAALERMRRALSPA